MLAIRARPYGCTFDECLRNFFTLNGWAEHELQHSLAESWRCDILSGYGNSPCMEVRSDLDTFKAHLQTNHGISHSNSEPVTSRCHIAADGNGSFWCGFCEKVVNVSDSRNKKENEKKRLSHISDHFSQGYKTYSWTKLRGGKTKGHGNTVLLEDPEKGESPNTTLLYSEPKLILPIRTTIEGDVVELKVYQNAISTHQNGRWLIFHPVRQWMKSVQSYQQSIPGSKTTGWGVCRPHEYLAVAPREQIDEEQWHRVRRLHEKMLGTLKLSDRAVWDRLGPHAFLMLLPVCRGQQFEVKGIHQRLHSWTIVERSVKLEFVRTTGEIEERTVSFENSWDLRRQGIVLVCPAAQFTYPPLWKKA